MVLRKRKRTDNFEVLTPHDFPESGPDVSAAVALPDNSSTNVEMMPSVAKGTRRSARQAALKVEPASNANVHKTKKTTHVKRRVKTASATIDNSEQALLESAGQQPPTKKARLDDPAAIVDSERGSLAVDLPQPNSIPVGAASPSADAGPSSLPTQETPGPESIPVKEKAKRKGKGKGKDAAPEDKRAARFKVKCPQNIMDRVQRVWQQRLFMIDRNRSEGELRETFSVLGSTGNVYTVVIDREPRCNCPDANKGNHCKHILFVFLKVLRVPEASSHWYQKALLTPELEEIFTQAPLAPNCVVHQQVRDALLASSKGQDPGAASSSQQLNRRLPTEEDNCPICYETMHDVPENTLKFCDTCGNALHDECWKQWEASSVRTGKPVTCVWCRAETNPAATRRSQATGKYRNEGYLNLGAIAGCSPKRDTSTYHRPGRNWGNSHREYEFDD